MGRETVHLRRAGETLHAIHYLATHGPVGADRAAKDLGISTKELDALCDRIIMVGVPPYLPNDYVSIWRGGGRIEVRFADHFRGGTRLTFREALALRLSAQELLGGPGRDGREQLEGFLAKVEAAMRDHDVPGDAPRLASRVKAVHGRKGTARTSAVLDRAIDRRETVHVEYYSDSRDAMGERDLDPYGVFEHAGNLYLVARDGKSDEIRRFRVDRIRSIRTTGRTFVPPADLDLHATIAGRSYDPPKGAVKVRVKFTGPLVPLVREWYAPETLEPAAAGGLIYTLHTADPAWLARWILQFGRHAEVLGPPPMRQAVARGCRDFLRARARSTRL